MFLKFVIISSQCTYKRNTEARSRNHCCRGKALSFTYSECVSAALFIRHVMRMHHIILSSVACPLYHIFPYYLQSGTVFEKKAIEHEMCIDFPYNFCQNIYYSTKNVERYYHKFT